METIIKGSPSFAYVDVALGSGEAIIAESDAMSTMAAELDLKARLNGGLFSALCKKFLGGESLFINEYANNTGGSLNLTLTQSTPGDIMSMEIGQDAICLQPGAFICCTKDVRLGVRWAGFASGISREGFFKLQVTGPGTVWFGAYGGLVEKEIDGEYIVDTSHLVAYEPQMKLKVQMAGGIFSSFFSGEGLVTRVEGKGKIWIQTRSLSGLAGWINPKL
jgi:uncharacterized protein (TIGR00266 family)